ncbi:MAG: hypothetical protein IH852_13495 [Bacteroidetes bacterium]|nr:hypothetical protein [Bacteroidota bacterium]
MNIIKQKAAKILVNLKLKRGEFYNQSFSSAFKSSNSFLVLMPADNKDFQYAVNILDYLEELKKDFSILTFDYRVSLLPLRFRERAHGHGIKDINKIDLPSRRLISNLTKKKYDALLDLNRKEQLFYTYVSGIMNAAVSIGFTKSFADKAYNIQIANSETNSKISYENLLNCLKML